MKMPTDKTLAAWFVPLLAANACWACVVLVLLFKVNGAVSSYRSIESIKCSEFNSLSSEQQRDIAFWMVGKAFAGVRDSLPIHDRLPKVAERAGEANPDATLDFLALAFGSDFE